MDVPAPAGGVTSTKASYLDQSATLSFDLIAAPVEGDYLFCDTLSIVTVDAGATMNYTITFADQTGARFITTSLQSSMASKATLGVLNWLGYTDSNESNVSVPLHLVAGTAFHVQIDVTGVTTLKFTYNAQLLKL